jgi:hypothetical protein
VFDLLELVSVQSSKGQHMSDKLNWFKWTLVVYFTFTFILSSRYQLGSKGQSSRGNPNKSLFTTSRSLEITLFKFTNR